MIILRSGRMKFDFAGVCGECGCVIGVQESEKHDVPRRTGHEDAFCYSQAIAQCPECEHPVDVNPVFTHDLIRAGEKLMKKIGASHAD